MKRFALVFVLVLMAYGITFAEDQVWLARNSPIGAKAAYEFYKTKFEAKNTYTYAWKLARAAYFYAANFVQNNDVKKKVYTEGKEAAEDAMAIDPNGFEGFYQYAVCLGSWAEMHGVGEQLGCVDKIIKACEKAIKISPNNPDGYMVMARVYHKAPGWPISCGDINKAAQLYEKALKLGGNSRTLYRFYAECLIDQGKKKEAKAVIEKGLALAVDPSDKVTENQEIDKLKSMMEKVK
jgi:tetratricopeptide (TPR) repeat protein